MIRLLFAFCCLPGAATALPDHAPMRGHVEASMLVTGNVDIDRAGQVTAHTLDQRERLPDYVASLVDRAVPQLRFEPVLLHGQPVLARAKMSLLLVARQAGDGEMQISIRNANFGEDATADYPGSVRAASMRPPSFSAERGAAGRKGTVYLLVKVARDGAVE